MHCSLCLFFTSSFKVFGGCFRQAFFHLENKKKWWSLGPLERWLSYTVTIIWEFAWADSALFVLDKWLFYSDGHLTRFHCNALS